MLVMNIMVAQYYGIFTIYGNSTILKIFYSAFFFQKMYVQVQWCWKCPKTCVCLQISLRVNQLLGVFSLLNSNLNGKRRPSSLYVTAELSSSGHSLGVQLRTPFTESDGHGAQWDSVLKFPIKVSVLDKLYSYDTSYYLPCYKYMIKSWSVSGSKSTQHINRKNIHGWEFWVCQTLSQGLVLYSMLWEEKFCQSITMLSPICLHSGFPAHYLQLPPAPILSYSQWNWIIHRPQNQFKHMSEGLIHDLRHSLCILTASLTLSYVSNMIKCLPNCWKNKGCKC